MPSLNSFLLKTSNINKTKKIEKHSQAEEIWCNELLSNPTNNAKQPKAAVNSSMEMC